MAFYIGFYAYAIIVHTRADQLLPQLLMEQFDNFPIRCRQIEHMHKGVWFRKNNFWQNGSCENLEYFFPNRAFIYALMVPSWADQLLPQLLIEQFDTLPIQCRHIWTYAWRSLVQKQICLTKWQLWELREISLIRLLYMRRRCIHGPINSYHSF